MPADEGTTSLASYGESVPPWSEPCPPESDPSAEPPERCQRRPGFSVLNEETGEHFPARCGANFCPPCQRMNAGLIKGAIDLAKPQRFVRLSLAGDDWITARNRVKRLTHRARQEVEWHGAWHREPNPKGTGSHVHMFQTGDYLDQGVLQKMCHQVGLGFPFIEAWDQNCEGAGYGLKGVGYGLKGLEAEESARVYLEHNGGRLVHATRGFWRDEHGNSVGLREAMRAYARTKNPDQKPGTWRLVMDTSL